MMTQPLVYVRKTTVYAVPPICSAYWTADDWRKVSRVVVEPLTIDALGSTWTATGERNAQGQLLYSRRQS